MITKGLLLFTWYFGLQCRRQAGEDKHPYFLRVRNCLSRFVQGDIGSISRVTDFDGVRGQALCCFTQRGKCRILDLAQIHQVDKAVHSLERHGPRDQESLSVFSAAC